MSSIPPVPNVIFAGPGATQPRPMSEACWSPAMPRIIGAPSSAVAGARSPVESTMVGSIDPGMPSRSSNASSQPRPSPVSNPVRPALVASVMWASPRVRTKAIHESTVPKQRSRERSGSCSERRCVSLVADWFGAKRRPSACSTRQSPRVRRSCQPRPLATGSPVARSQTMVEARWLVMPIDAIGPWFASMDRARSSVVVAMTIASNSTSPGAGDSGSAATRRSSMIVVPSTTATRTLDVPTSMTRMLIVKLRSVAPPSPRPRRRR